MSDKQLKIEGMKEKFIEAVNVVDTSIPNWNYMLIDSLPKCYAKGYLEAKQEEWNEHSSFVGDDFKEELLDLCNHDIWF